MKTDPPKDDVVTGDTGVVDEVDMSVSLVRITTAGVATILQQQGFIDPLQAALIAVTGADLAGSAVEHVRQRFFQAAGAVGAYLGRRPEKRELFSGRLRLPEGASVGAEYFRRAADAAGLSSLKDMAGIVVNGLTQQSIEEDFVRTILRRTSELSQLEALHLKHHCLSHWSKTPGAQRKLEIEHPEVFGASSSPIGPEETHFRRTMALRRLENGGYLESHSHPKKPGDQGPFYKPTELTRRMYLLIDDPDLPHETVTWRRD